MLLEWAMEVLVKHAVDALAGRGGAHHPRDTILHTVVHRLPQGGGGAFHWFCQSSPISLPDSESCAPGPDSHEMATPSAMNMSAVRLTPRTNRVGARTAAPAATVPRISKARLAARRDNHGFERALARTLETTLASERLPFIASLYVDRMHVPA